MKKRRVFYVMCSVLKLRAINQTNENRQIIKLQPAAQFKKPCCPAPTNKILTLLSLFILYGRLISDSEFGPGSLEIAARSLSAD